MLKEVYVCLECNTVYKISFPGRKKIPEKVFKCKSIKCKRGILKKTMIINYT